MNLPPPLSAHELATADAQAKHALTDGYYGQFELNKLRPSPDNRKRFNEQALQELAASIKTMGVAQAILIRPVTPTAESPEPFEIVAGERRFRASKIAGKATIPALCRQLSDLDAAKIRILENLQREDPHPMEEAEGYQLLMLQHGFTADQLVDEVKKSRSYIYGRLKLCALGLEVRELFLDNKLPASTALLIARIPTSALQAKAAKEVLNPQYGSEPMSYRQAATWVQQRYMLDLGTAIFSLTDAKLLAAAGACTKCPKRAGNQPEIFEGVSADVCTDPDCFAEKKAAHHNALITTANKRGIPVHEATDYHAMHSSAWSRDSELVHVDVHLSYFQRNAPTTGNAGYLRDHLNEETLPQVAAYGKTGNGDLKPFYRRVDVQQALEAAGVCETVEAHAERMRILAENPELAPPKTAAQIKREKEEAEHQARRAESEKESAFRIALYKQLRGRASASGLSLPSLREYVRAVHDEHGLDSSTHDIYDFDVRTDLDDFINRADANALQLLLLDLMLGSRLDATWWHGDEDDNEFGPILAMARHEGIDIEAARGEIFSPITAPAVRYRNPNDATQTWTGRGRQPKWVSDWIESGKRLEQLETNPPVAAGQDEAAPAVADQIDAVSQHQVETTPAAVDVANVTGQAQDKATPTTAGFAEGSDQPQDEAPPAAADLVHDANQLQDQPAAAEHADGEQLAEQLLEAMSAAPSPAAPEKKAPKKATPAKATGKAKPTAAATKTASKPAPKKTAASKTASSKTAEAA
ncbi:ParB/RepB/Spo0J family partition protein [Massilia oculi]|uniref:ParB/RepB/Spo0J family partition protein n=1 Tax=Massilia oculi TaxID=945844 RepID=UPI001AB00DC3|nr:ParB/RepB/Spo0J family partition protein [Massilia oculi]